MSTPDFAHLHVHSEYSLLDGANRIGDLVAACKKDGQRALALTDHGNMFGAIELYQAARKEGVKPIIGCEVYIARNSRKLPHNKGKGNGYHHLTLMARNAAGYKNLIQLASYAYLEGYHFRPRIDRELLARHAEGITCLSGCLASELSQLALAGNEQAAFDLATTWRDMFGKEHFWLELQRNGLDLQTRVNETVVRIHQQTGIPIVATNDIHYLREEDCQAQDVLLCINTGAKRSDVKRFRFETDSLYFKTRAEMADMFRDLEGAVRATMDVADQVNLEIEFGKYHLPIFTPDTPETADEVFDRLLEEGLLRHYPRSDPAKAAYIERARERVTYEKRVIRELGFVSYFLIVWDLIRWARDHGVPVGPGRGSAAGSIVAYLLGITKVDPLRYDLLFERFLNSSRISMPDIDIDFCKEGRESVLAYTRQRYGNDHVAQIVTFGTMQSRTVVRDVARVLDLPLKDVDRVAKKIPAGPGAPSLSEALAKDPDLKKMRAENPQFEELFKLSMPLEGLARHISTHAAGVVIADRPIMDYVPLAKNGDDICTQWPSGQLEQLGLLKMDYLGLRTLTILERTLRNIQKQGGTPPDLDQLPEEDPATYKMLTSGDTLGVFQLESDGMKKLLGRIRPDCFEDLIAILALYRPGPLEAGMVEMFTKRKHGEEAISYPHSSLEAILRDTYGCIVYQEQVMLISSALGSFSLNEADNLRKAMSKKAPEIMKKFSEQFVTGAVKNGCAAHIASEVWDNILKFGGYGFNKSHSTAYALITYQTAFLKAHFRSAFLAANLSCEMSDSGKVKDLVDDVRRSGIELRPPNIERSTWEFEPEDAAIRFGVGAIKGTGPKAIDLLLGARDALRARGARPALHALCSQIDPASVGKVTFEALIQAGAFDSSGYDRGALLATLDVAMSDGTRAALDRKSGQTSLFGAAFGGAAVDSTTSAGTGASAGSRGDGVDPAKAWTRQATLRAEFEVLGFYLSGHPLEDRAGLLALLSSVRLEDLPALPGGTEVQVTGLILSKHEMVVKSGSLAGKKMCRFRLEDLKKSVSVTCFPRTYEEQKHKIEDGAIVLCKAKLEEDSEEPALLLNEIFTIEEALARFQGGVVVSVEPEDEGRLDELKGLIARHRGAAPLYFQVRGIDGRLRRVRAGPQTKVSISESFAREVDHLLGKGRMKLARL